MGRIGKIILISFAFIFIVLVLTFGIFTYLFIEAKQSNVGELTFDKKLYIPELLEPTVDEQGRKEFNIEFQEGEMEWIDGKKTKTWGLNGPYLSPTLRASKGDEVVVNVSNATDEETTLHWHGMILPGEMDGGPHQLIQPGETWSPTWKIKQPAATTWFHPHTHGKTAEHVYRGAAGMFIIDDPDAQSLNIPQNYGVDDIPLIIQDKRFSQDGSMNSGAPFFSNVGTLGDHIVVNGTLNPYFEATTNLVRFRILNASNARVYDLGFNDNRSFFLIGTDSGLLEEPVEMERLMLSPGERAEIVVKISSDDNVILKSYAPDLSSPFWAQRFNGGDDTFDILNIRGASKLVDLGELPSRLVDIDFPIEEDVVKRRTFDLVGQSTINGKPMNMHRIDEVVTIGSTEIWEIRNPRSETYHNFHAHGIHFALLELNGQEPPDHLKGWKDTIFLPPESTATVIAKFDAYAGTDAPFMYHCHILMHEDAGMMGQFIVVDSDTDIIDKIEKQHENIH